MSDLAIKYRMKQRLAKGGDVKKGHHDDIKGVHKPVSGEGSGRYPGMSEAGEDYRDSRLGYGEESPAGGQNSTYRKHAKDKHHQVLAEIKMMKKPHGKYADGGDVESAPEPGSSFNKSTGKKISDSFMGMEPECEHGSKECEMCHGGKMMADGGQVATDHDSEGLDMIDYIMRQRAMADGGAVSNDTGDGESVDEEENQFDNLVLMDRDTSDEDYNAANSGDELGNEQKDEDERDLVAQIMKSRSKKDRLPNPR